MRLDVKPTSEKFKIDGKGNTLAGCVQIMGSWQGTVALLCPMPLARKASAIMFGVEEETAGTEEIQDALGELANMTGGNIKSLLPEPCYLSLPAVAVTDYGLRIPGSELVTEVTFQCQGYQFVVSLLKRVDTPENQPSMNIH